MCIEETKVKNNRIKVYYISMDKNIIIAVYIDFEI